MSAGAEEVVTVWDLTFRGKEAPAADELLAAWRDLDSPDASTGYPAVRTLAAGGSAVLYSTHYLQEVEDLGAEAVILDHGRVIARGGVRDLLTQYGSIAVELDFDGPPPALDLPWPTAQLGHVLRVTTEDVAAAVVAVLGALGPETSRLRSIEILRPSLETVFVTLTGRRFETEVEGKPAAARVALVEVANAPA